MLRILALKLSCINVSKVQIKVVLLRLGINVLKN